MSLLNEIITSKTTLKVILANSVTNVRMQRKLTPWGTPHNQTKPGDETTQTKLSR